MSIETERVPEIAKIRVLLVEDHLLTRMGLRAILGKTSEIEIVAEAENGRDAIVEVGKHKPDVVLMDVGMPVMDGIEAASSIRKLYPEVNIVMLTAHDSDRDILAALAAGAGGYCLKDAVPERLYRAIRSVSAGDIWLDSAIASRVMKFYSQGSGSGPRASAEGGQQSGSSSQYAIEEKSKFSELADPLSPREMEVLSLLVDGLSNQEIADKLIISLATTKTHVRNILNKLAVDDRTQAAVHAMRRGLV